MAISPGRLTAPLCVAGGIALQALERADVTIAAHIASLGPAGIADEGLSELELDEAQIARLRTRPFPTISADAGSQMTQAILDAREAGDSIGGVIECAAYGVPAGVGDPMFDGMENRIARLAFGVPAVKGVDFGAGFAVAYLTGSENNDRTASKTASCAPRPTTPAASSGESPRACRSSGRWP